mmetsp:Transcript_99923/g.282827  ORF Transcript_99923/g.282827 Transcript_99923/m.282827 type:complete len:550 (+) Transcript_99923:100-1749(+)
MLFLMSIRTLVVLAAAVLYANSVAVALKVAAGSVQGEPFSDAFDDFYVDEPSERMLASGSQEGILMATGLRPGVAREGRPRRSKSAEAWAPPTRNGFLPFAGPMPSPNWENRMLIAKKNKFAFCYIEKNACTQFNFLMNGLNGMPTRDRIPFWKSNSDGVYKEYLKTQNVSRADGWSMSIFVREPTERFLSAWLSKCDAWEYGGIDCLGPRVTDLTISQKVELFEKTVVELLPTYMAKSRENGGVNAHYDPQHSFCGGRKLSEYNFVGVLAGSPDNIHRQVKHMLQDHARVSPRAKIMHLSDQLFPTTSKAGHGTNTVNLMKAFYRNRTILQMVMEQFAADYDWAGPAVNAAWAQSRRAASPDDSALKPQASPTASPTAGPTASPTASRTTSATAPPSTVRATGDPHLTNLFGQRFDLHQEGWHTLVRVPRGAQRKTALLSVEAEARQMGAACADVYFQSMNLTGRWVGANGRVFSASSVDTKKYQGWLRYGKVELKVVHGHTQSGIVYLNIFVRNLKRAGYVVGGLLGMDDHTAAVASSQKCRKTINL